MKTVTLLLGLVLAIHIGADAAAMTLAKDGKARCVILQQPGATPAELQAARDLSEVLKEITGATFSVQEASTKIPKSAIIIGPGPAARSLFPGVPFDQLGLEEIVIKTKGNRLLLAGGRPRGTLYAVSQFLQEQCAVRWWTPWASRVPKNPNLTVGKLDVRYRPVFESRDPFWYPAFNPQWAVRNFSNSQSAHIPEEMGGCISYRGFVHTFYPLVPPEEHFATHPEWYSMVKGKRTTEHAQLCLSNPQLRDYVVQKVRQWLKESPQARIISVSQNDWHGACECPDCKAVDDAEGSKAGTMIHFVNYVAEKIEADFPLVAIDTLAYQYTRKPPRTVKPRPNVIVRLCSIECNFREPLDHPSNATFADDIRGWSKICNRLYIWDYTTDFAHYTQPHPNWYVLGPNLRFFEQHHVRGVFEQGAYQSFGSELAELRAWVLAQLLWNPRKDDRALIKEFIEGYYGAAAPFVSRYLDTLHDASRGSNLSCFSKTDMPFLQLTPLVEAERLWGQAEKAVAGDATLLPRVRLGHLPVRYAWLSLWTQLRKQAQDSGVAWPLPASRKAVADEWLALAKGVPGMDWTRVTLVNESGVTPEKWVERFAKDPAEPSVDKPSAAAPSQPLPKVQVSRDGRAFVKGEATPFVPCGLTYFRPNTGWAPQVWKQFDAAATRQDFARMKGLGVNCVRVFLSFGSLYEKPGTLSPDGLAKLDQFLALAEEAGIYVHPTGPDHWEGLPEWARGDRLADEQVLSALESFWKLLATRYSGRNVIFAYDLLNEPEVRWDTPSMRVKWNQWLTAKYATADKLGQAWGKVDGIPQFGDLVPPEPKDAPGNPELLDYQLFRESVADEWTRRQVAAIKAADSHALVTTGLIQWSVPALIGGPRYYSAFRPERQAPFLDFMEVHFYPLNSGFYSYTTLEEGTRNLAYLESVVREVARFTKPVVVAEFGWYGGGKLTLDGGKHPAATEEQQAEWCSAVVETTACMAAGWLNWGLYDHPQAGDVTQLTGLLTADGKLKAWGRRFQELAARFQSQPMSPLKLPSGPQLDWTSCITSSKAGNAFRDLYFKARESHLSAAR